MVSISGTVMVCGWVAAGESTAGAVCGECKGGCLGHAVFHSHSVVARLRLAPEASLKARSYKDCAAREERGPHHL